jgi:hypothetical protein
MMNRHFRRPSAGPPIWIENIISYGNRRKPSRIEFAAFHIPRVRAVLLAGAAQAPLNFRTADLPIAEPRRGQQNLIADPCASNPSV